MKFIGLKQLAICMPTTVFTRAFVQAHDNSTVCLRYLCATMGIEEYVIFGKFVLSQYDLFEGNYADEISLRQILLRYNILHVFIIEPDLIGILTAGTVYSTHL
jgi:hypothetical protein